eukprot:GEMP01089473.1.p1 GENE.GEMP01089473.1~~GEMP01089473.1.p1  ORF type:complete len:155 (+),score=18.88 GEMP01089473.1:111-575(+)
MMLLAGRRILNLARLITAMRAVHITEQAMLAPATIVERGIVQRNNHRIDRSRKTRQRSRSPRGEALAVSSYAKAMQNALPLVERQFALNTKSALLYVFPDLQATPEQYSRISSDLAKCAHRVYTEEVYQEELSSFSQPSATPTSGNSAKVPPPL